MSIYDESFIATARRGDLCVAAAEGDVEKIKRLLECVACTGIKATYARIALNYSIFRALPAVAALLRR